MTAGVGIRANTLLFRGQSVIYWDLDGLGTKVKTHWISDRSDTEQLSCHRDMDYVHV
jgi:hypothetical protein